ncbi:MAG TPA: fumarylacetoacetate hydrolase family protein [Pseudolysinimonas sp.]|jgi:fumarylpyruvate hydrolase
MSDAGFVIAPQPIPTARVAGSDGLWPIRRVLCVGRNYADHAREMGADPTREAPFFFSKPADAVVPAQGVVPYPPLTESLHHEIELVVAIGRRTAGATPEHARGSIFGYAVGVDLTRRDLQDEAKELRRPWDGAKGFDRSAPMSAIHPRTSVLESGPIWLSVNGERRQTGDLSQMIWGVPEIISFASQGIELLPGDLIFTGTPAGVSALTPGDRVTGGIDSLEEIDFEVGAGR